MFKNYFQIAWRNIVRKPFLLLIHKYGFGYSL